MGVKFNLCILAIVFGIISQPALSANPQDIPDASIPPEEVTTNSALRTTRNMHNLFHQIRMNFYLLDAIEQKQIDDLGWKPNYVSFVMLSNGTQIYLKTANGEDFIYMHRKMIEKVNSISEEAGETWRVDGWDECPEPDDADWPLPGVPDDITDADYITYLEGYKSDDYLEDVIREREDFLNVPANLAAMNLGEIGAVLEYELHTDFHVRFAAYCSAGYRIPGFHPTEYVDEMWDVKEYDYLADFYSAHVNPTFWKIHGWIEKMMVKWADAHGLDSENLEWSSVWEGGPAETIDQLAQVAADGAYRMANPDDGDSTSAGKIVGSVFGGLVAGFIIALIGFMCMLKLSKKNEGAKPHHTHESKPLKGTGGTNQTAQDEVKN